VGVISRFFINFKHLITMAKRKYYVEIVNIHVTDDGDGDTFLGADLGEIYYKFSINGDVVAELNSNQAIQANTGSDIHIGIGKEITVEESNSRITVSGGVSEDDSNVLGRNIDPAGMFFDVFEPSNGWQGLESLNIGEIKTFQRRLKDLLDVTVNYTIKLIYKETPGPDIDIEPEKPPTEEQIIAKKRRDEIGTAVILYSNRNFRTQKIKRGDGPFGEPLEIPHFSSQTFENTDDFIAYYDFPYVKPDDDLLLFNPFKFSIQPNTLKSIELGNVAQVVLFDKPLSEINKSGAKFQSLPLGKSEHFLLTRKYYSDIDAKIEDPEGWENKAVSMMVTYSIQVN
jgi:hypothetical protein